MQGRLKTFLVIGASTLIGLAGANANAAGSELFFDNVSGMGNAYSGKAAVADDASTEYFNPAGLTYIKQQEIVLGDIQGRFNGKFTGSTTFNIPPFVTIPQTGFANGSATVAPFPFFYYARPIADKFFFGFGILTPTGIGISVPEDTIVRYVATRAS